MAFVLAAGSSHSFNRFVRTSLHYFIRSPHQLQHRTWKCFVPQHPHLSNPQQQHYHLSLPAKCLPHNPRFPIILALINLHRSFNHAIEMRITAHTPPGASYFPIFNSTSSSYPKFDISFSEKIKICIIIEQILLANCNQRGNI